MSNVAQLAWNKVDWKKIESRVFRIQRRIYKAKTDKKITTVHYLQKKLINSLDGKLTSIREVFKLTKVHWINSIHFHGTNKSIHLIYTSLKKPHALSDNSLIDKTLLTDEAKQFLIKLALEPEWASKFEHRSMGHNFGQSYQDSIENTFSKFNLSTPYVFQKKIFENFKNFDLKRFLKKLNTIKVIEIHIKRWLLNLDKFKFENKKTNYYPDSNFGLLKRGNITPFLCEIALNGLETYLISFMENNKNYFAQTTAIHYCRYLDEVLIISPKIIILNQLIKLYQQYLHKVGLRFGSKNYKVLHTTEGINFLGFQLIIIKKENQFKKKISISRDSKKLLLARTRFIIQKNKSISSYELIKKLKYHVLFWGLYFQYYDCKKEFAQMDQRILNQLRAWVFRRKAQGKNRSFLKEKYFPTDKVFTYNGINYKNSWVLCGDLKLANKKIDYNFLPKLSWIKRTSYIAIENDYSIYNGDYLYWSKRLSNIETEQYKLLQKKFLLEGKMEIYNLFTTANKYFVSK